MELNLSKRAVILRLILGAVVLFFPRNSLAQNTGVSDPTDEDIDFYQTNVIQVTSPKGLSIPVRVKNTQYLPRIRNQLLQSCGAYAPTYYYKTYQEAREHGWVRPDVAVNPERVMSPGFTYPLVNGGLNQGANVLGTMRVMLKHGVATWAEMPENGYDYTTWPSENVWRSAMLYRADKVGVIQANTPQGLIALKEHLASGDLGVITIGPIDQAFDGYPNVQGDVLTGTSGPVRDVRGHALTIVGYDDSKSYLDNGVPKQGAILAVNSWGDDWGIPEPAFGGESWTLDPGGYLWIGYDYFQLAASEVSFMIDKINYQPQAIAVVEFEHPRRIELVLSLMSGDKITPNWRIKLLSAGGGGFGYNGRLVTDVTEVTDGNDLTYWLEAFDANLPIFGPPVTGAIKHFSIELPNGITRVSADGPVNTIDYTSGPPYGRVFLQISDLQRSVQDLEDIVDVNYGAALAWADIDNDGDQDLVVGGWMYGEGYVSKLLRNNEGTFLDANANLPGFVEGSYSWGDFDSDGLVDLALCGNDDQRFISKVFRNRGDGRFAELPLNLPGRTSCALAWGDLDNDGDLDLALVGRDENGVQGCELYRNEKGEALNAAWSGLCTQTRSTAIADLDNDGLLDFAVNQYVFKNKGGWSFEQTIPFPGLSNTYTRATAIGDINGDGWLDVGLIGADIYTVTPFTKIFRNTGGMNFVDIGTNLQPLLDGAASFGDLDGNGLQDFAVIGYLSVLSPGIGTKPQPFTRLYLNYGSGMFNDSGSALTDIWQGGIALADVEGDYDLDIAVAGSGEYPYPLPNNTKHYLNNLSIRRPVVPPGEPQQFSHQLSDNDVTLNWSPGTDTETAQAGLYYYLRLGTERGGRNVISPASGFSVIGNRPATRIGAELGIKVAGLTPGAHYLSVQTVAASGDLSAWSPDYKFIVPGRIFCDVNSDDSANLLDIFALIDAAASDTSLPGLGDANGDGQIQLSDVDYLFRYYFLNGAAPRNSCAREVQ